jgi:hypothetical protein
VSIEERKNLCLECKHFNPEDRTRNCYDANSVIEFALHHVLKLIVIGCKGFEQRGAVEEVKVIPSHEFENDVMKSREQQTQEAEIEAMIEARANRIAREEAEAEKEMTKQAQEAEVQQELKEKGGNDADHRTE